MAMATLARDVSEIRLHAVRVTHGTSPFSRKCEYCVTNSSLGLYICVGSSKKNRAVAGPPTAWVGWVPANRFLKTVIIKMGVFSDWEVILGDSEVEEKGRG
jgi:hypothetical protein